MPPTLCTGPAAFSSWARTDGSIVRVLRYPTNRLLGDYLRSAVGLGVGGGVLLSVPPNPAIVAVFGGLTALFSLFGLRTVQRHMMQVAVTDDEIATSDFRTRTVAWSDLQRVRLRFYGTRPNQFRIARGGFMELLLIGPQGKMRFESSLEGFNYLAWQAARAVRGHGVTIDPTSAGNLLDLGIDVDRDQPPPELPPGTGASGGAR